MNACLTISRQARACGQGFRSSRARLCFFLGTSHLENLRCNFTAIIWQLLESRSIFLGIIEMVLYRRILGALLNPCVGQRDRQMFLLYSLAFFLLSVETQGSEETGSCDKMNKYSRRLLWLRRGGKNSYRADSVPSVFGGMEMVVTSLIIIDAC
ncbi:hypothetical protein PM082_013709 [Marasmius tenuissimus]|nr:hypothetical protein PM082_013709 [Marasmius tenuissimus]